MSDTYASDLDLFKQLGLEPFTGGGQAERYAGRVAIGLDGSYVDVFVSCYPAQFWRFIIHNAETGKTCEMETGSGSLADYWRAVDIFAKGMADITYLDAEPELPPGPIVVPDGPRMRLSPLT